MAPLPMPPTGGSDDDMDDQPQGADTQPQREGPGTPKANYTGPENQCGACQYFDGRSKCSNGELLADKPDGMVDPAGRCDEWEAKTGGDKNAPSSGKPGLGARLLSLGKPPQAGGMAAGGGADAF